MAAALIGRQGEQEGLDDRHKTGDEKKDFFLPKLDVLTSKSIRTNMESKSSKVVTLRLSPELAKAFKVEAAKRDMKLNAFFAEIFDNYSKTIGTDLSVKSSEAAR